MAIDYVVVRRRIDKSRLQGSGPDAEAPAADGPPVARIVSVGVEKLDEAEAQERNADPEFAAVPDMPVALIRPLAGPAAQGDEADALEEAKKAGMSWGIAAVGADATMPTGAGVRVAVIDTGIDRAHPAFAGLAIEARNFLRNQPEDDVTDRDGHGTHCAGTIFGRDVDGVRIGVAPGVTSVLVAKALDDRGRGSMAAVLKALVWAGERKANVVSLSVGFDFPGMVERWVEDGLPARFATAKALIAYREATKLFEDHLALLHGENALSRGALIAAASGNESEADADPAYVVGASVPAASAPDVISVGAAFRAKDGRLGIAPFSNTGPRVSAPGVGIVSAQAGGGLAAKSGTSMACPHVAGVAALWWQSLKLDGMGESAANVRASLVAGAHPRPFTPETTVAQRGKGLVQAP